MRKKIKFLYSVSLLTLSSQYGYSDIFIPSSSCSKPYKLYGGLSSKYELESFNNKITSYQLCIKSFVNTQAEQAANHQKAAQKAIDEWNDFVKYELKQ